MNTFWRGSRPALIGAVCVSLGWLAGDELTTYLASDGRLTAAFEVSSEQEGFAGVVRDVWSCGLDGKWRTERFVNSRSMTHPRTGELAPKQLKELARIFKAEKLNDLPEQLGHKASINPKRIIISFGKKKCTCLLEPGESLKEAVSKESKGPKAATWKRAFAIYEAAEKLFEKAKNELSKDKSEKTKTEPAKDKSAEKKSEAPKDESTKTKTETDPPNHEQPQPKVQEAPKP